MQTGPPTALSALPPVTVQGGPESLGSKSRQASSFRMTAKGVVADCVCGQIAFWLI